LSHIVALPPEALFQKTDLAPLDFKTTAELPGLYALEDPL